MSGGNAEYPLFDNIIQLKKIIYFGSISGECEASIGIPSETGKW
jgi:hypothetical protein